MAKQRNQELLGPLIADLAHEASKVRCLAAEFLGDIRDKRAMALIKALGDAVWDVRYTAVEALGKIGERDAIPPIIDCVARERNFRVRGRGLLVLKEVFRCLDARTLGQISASWEREGINPDDRNAGF
jgi:HEAT repeat protein